MRFPILLIFVGLTTLTSSLLPQEAEEGEFWKKLESVKSKDPTEIKAIFKDLEENHDESRVAVPEEVDTFQIIILSFFGLMGSLWLLAKIAEVWLPENTGIPAFVNYASHFIWPFLLGLFGIVGFMKGEGWGIPLLCVAGIVVILLIYLIPTYVCVVRDTQYKNGIILLNIFLGWSFLGWVAALILAAVAPKKDLEEKNLTKEQKLALTALAIALADKVKKQQE